METPLATTPGKSRGPMRFAMRVRCAMHECIVTFGKTLIAPAGAIPAVAAAVREISPPKRLDARAREASPGGLAPGAAL